MKTFNSIIRITFFVLFFILSAAPDLCLGETARATLVSVVDGDTIRITRGSKPELLRLIGIDAPEENQSEKLFRQAERSNTDIKTIVGLGTRSANFLKTRISQGDKLLIEFDTVPRDKYGRLLGYVFADDGSLLNETIVREGYAQLLTIAPNTKYQKRLEVALEEAREAGRGLWGFGAFAKLENTPKKSITKDLYRWIR